MLQHYISTAWRHMLKYRTQNVISILCLAVGVVCFTLAIQAVLTASTVTHAWQIKAGTHLVRIEVSDATRQYPHKVDSAMIAQIHRQGLSSVRDVEYWFQPFGKDFTFEDATSVHKICFCYFNNVSPGTFAHRGIRSAITGNPIPEPDEGDVLISDDIRDRVYGKGADPRGFRVLSEIDGGIRTIRDVVPTSLATSEYGACIFYISRTPIARDGLSVPGRRAYDLTVEANEGYTDNDVVQELRNAFPGLQFTPHMTHYDSRGMDDIPALILFAIVVMIGGSVLVVGLSGYLKMQTQLFALRSRELALRRTMGARRWQLFMPLAVETVMAFVLTALATELFTALLTPYILQPFLTALRLNITFTHELQQFHCIKWYVLLGTLAMTLCMAAWMVRRQLHEQLSARVGRSGHPRTKGQSLMLCMQFATGMTLLVVTLWGYRLLSLADDDWDYVVTANTDAMPDFAPYRHALIVRKLTAEQLIPGFADSLHAVRGIEHISTVRYDMREATTVDTALVIHHDTIWPGDRDGQTILRYSMMASDEELADRLHPSISPTPYRNDPRWRFATAIYARSEDAARLRRKWHLPDIPDAPARTLHGSRAYTLLGYVPCPRGYQRKGGWQPTPSYWLIDNDSRQDVFPRDRDREDAPIFDDYIIFSNGLHYARVEKKVQAMLQQAFPGNRNRSDAQNLYEMWFAQRHLLDMLRSICFLPVLISILCIIAEVYAAISLECRGRQKEIALRKIHGACRRDIVRMMGRHYLRLLLAAGIISTVLGAGTIVVLMCLGATIDYAIQGTTLLFTLASFLVVTAVTLLTILHKIRTVSRLDAARIIAKE